MRNAVDVSPPTLDRATRRDWCGLALLAVPSLMVAMNSNLLNLALPELSAELRPSAAQLLWISDSYVFLLAGFLLPMGILGDRIGRRRILLAGAAAFAIASTVAAGAPEAGMLIAARALLGIAGATLMPSTLSLIRVMFQVPAQRAVALGAWTASFALGGIIGPLVGGALIDTWSWRSVFFVAPPAMMLLIVVGPFLLPEMRDRTARRVDLVGVTVSVAGLLAVVFGIKRLAAGWDLSGALVLAAGIAAVAAFLHRESRRADPTLDVSLFRRVLFSVPLAGNAVAFGVLYANQLLTGQYLQSVLGLSPLAAGAWTIPSAAGYLLGSLVGPRLSSHLAPEVVLGGGLLVAATGFGMVTGISGDGGLALLVLGGVVFSVGLAPVYIVTTDLTVSSVSPDRAGVASATLETVTNLGGAFGIAVFGSAAGAIYRHGMSSAPDEAQTIGAAVAHAGGLPEPQRSELLSAAAESFVSGFRLVEGAGALLLVITAVVTAVAMRPSTRRQSQAHAEQEPVGL